MSVYAKMLPYFLTQKCFKSLPFWGAEEIPVGYCLLELNVLFFFMHFLNSSLVNAADMKKLSTVTPPQEPKEGSTMPIITFFP